MSRPGAAKETMNWVMMEKKETLKYICRGRRRTDEHGGSDICRLELSVAEAQRSGVPSSPCHLAPAIDHCQCKRQLTQ